MRLKNIAFIIELTALNGVTGNTTSLRKPLYSAYFQKREHHEKSIF